MTPTVLPTATELEYQEAERTLWRRIVVWMAVGAPLGALTFAALTGAAAQIAGVGLEGPILAGAVIGTLAGLFWGMWAGVCVSVAKFEELEGHPHQPRQPRG
jgi:hypothetical protein